MSGLICLQTELQAIFFLRMRRDRSMVHLPVFALAFTACLLLIAVATDLLWRKVHNLVTIPLIVSGMLYHTLQSGVAGFVISVAAVLAAVGLLIVPFLKGGLGAGDIKLLSGLGAWALFPDVVWIFGIAGLLFGALSLWLRSRVETWEGEAPAEPPDAGPRCERLPACLRSGRDAAQQELRPPGTASCQLADAIGRQLPDGRSRWKVVPFALLLAVATVARFLMTRGFRELSTAMEVQV
jgi:Flp pilus assembly protein protease CpaA